jgi:hypothetical protein
VLYAMMLDTPELVFVLNVTLAYVKHIFMLLALKKMVF